MRRVLWQDGEVITAEHFVELEHWTLRQVAGGRLGVVEMGLLPQRDSSAGSTIVQLDAEGRRARCGPLRALTSSGSLLELDEAVDLELERDRIGTEWSLLFLRVDEATRDLNDVPEDAELDTGPPLALPALRLSLRIPAGVEHLPVARVRLQGKKVILDNDYLPPCVLCDAHPLLAQELERWRRVVEEVSDQSLASAFRWQGHPNSGVAAQAVTFFWTAAATAAAALGDRVLTSERFFRAAARFGADILKVVEHFQPGQPDPVDLKSIVDRLASFDATTNPDYATAVEDSGNLRGQLRRLAQVVDPEPPAIELAGPPATTSDTQPDRWKVNLPLTKPLKHSVASDEKVLVAFRLKAGNNNFRVRVHPTKPWAAINQSTYVPIQQDVEARGLDGRFNAYFIYSPADDEREESRIVFHLLAEPVISDRTSVALEVLHDS
jgi:hypothetical protein